MNAEKYKDAITQVDHWLLNMATSLDVRLHRISNDLQKIRSQTYFLGLTQIDESLKISCPQEFIVKTDGYRAVLKEIARYNCSVNFYSYPTHVRVVIRVRSPLSL